AISLHRASRSSSRAPITRRSLRPRPETYPSVRPFRWSPGARWRRFPARPSAKFALLRVLLVEVAGDPRVVAEHVEPRPLSLDPRGCGRNGSVVSDVERNEARTQALRRSFTSLAIARAQVDRVPESDSPSRGFEAEALVRTRDERRSHGELPCPRWSVHA